MNILKPAIAGTLESSDCMITVMPSQGRTVELEINSVVYRQYGEAIRNVVEETLRNLGVREANVRIQDMGALDCVIAARVETAVKRASEVM